MHAFRSSIISLLLFSPLPIKDSAKAQQVRHDRSRLGGDVRQRHSRARRRAALLPRLLRHRQDQHPGRQGDRQKHLSWYFLINSSDFLRSTPT